VSIIDKVLRIGEGKILRQLEAIAKAVNAIEDDFVAMSDDELRGMTDEFKERLAAGESLDDLMPEAFATVREAAGSSASGITTSRSWAARRCTWATSRR
jgi:preprotein translocase subunit SecA